MESRVAIVGSGPAGLTAAIYAARGGLHPIVIRGQPAGGVLMTTTEVDNRPGFPDGIQGPELMENMRRQAVRLGAILLDDHVQSVDFQFTPFKLVTADQTVEAEAVIVAVGAGPRPLGLPAEMRLRGVRVQRMDVTAFKRVLKSLPLGTEVKSDGPHGSFVLHKTATTPAVFLIDGIGITPVRGIIAQAC